MRRLLLAALLLVAVASAGCQMRVDMTTTVLSEEEMEQEVVVSMRVPGGDASLADLGTAEDEVEGWTTEVKSEGDTVTVRTQKRLTRDDPMFPPSMQSAEAGESASETAFDLEVVDTPEGREYRVKVSVPASRGSTAGTTPGEEEMDPDMATFAEEMAKMMAEMLKVTWTINLPGEVVETNADTQTESGGTWVFRLDEMDKDRELTIVSREQ